MDWYLSELLKAGVEFSIFLVIMGIARANYSAAAGRAVAIDVYWCMLTRIRHACNTYSSYLTLHHVSYICIPTVCMLSIMVVYGYGACSYIYILLYIRMLIIYILYIELYAYNMWPIQTSNFSTLKRHMLALWLWCHMETIQSTSPHDIVHKIIVLLW